MDKDTIKHSGIVILGAALLFSLALLFIACDNVYVQEMLYGPSALDNLVVQADDFQSYDLKPVFTSTRSDYTATVPAPALKLQISGIAHKDGTVYYSSSADGTNYGAENSSGVFDFPLEMDSVFIKIRVLRPKMEETFYSLRIIRGSEDMLGAIKVFSGINSTAIDTAARALNPGFAADIYDYEVRVPQAAEALAFEGFINPAKVNIYYYKTNPVTDPGAVAYPGAALPTAAFPLAFPVAMDTIDVWIQVRPVNKTGTEDPVPGNWKTYHITVDRNKKVSLDPGMLTYAAMPEFVFEISGGAATTDPLVKAFGPGDPVAFTLIPPFGYQVSGDIEIIYNGAVAETKPVSPSNRYVFLMPPADVQIKAAFTKIPAATDTNVRYVWEGGSPGADALNWAQATSDLQKVIDNYNNTPGNPNNYEIWIAKGTYTPDWRTKTTVAGNTITAYNTNSLYWAYVLTPGVKIYGGFSGKEKSQADKAKRDITANETILSGDIGNLKTFRVMIAANVSFARVEGLTINGPYNSLYHGAMTINGAAILTGTNNGYGGICYIVNSSPLFKNVTFRYGFTDNASGVAVLGTGCPVFINCDFDHSQSSGQGSAIGLVSGIPEIPSLVMVGGTFSLNWDAGGVINVVQGRATLVNLSITNNLEHAIFASNDDVFVNLTVTGNRGSRDDSLYSVKGAAGLYNCVVKDNIATGVPALQNANVDNAALIKNTIAPGYIAAPGNDPGLTDFSSYTDRGNNVYYPVKPDGTWNTDPLCLAYTNISSSVTDLNVLEELRAALMFDGYGNPRFKGGVIDLGAEEK